MSGQVQFLQEELNKLKSGFKKDRERHKRNALRVKLSTAILAASATILLGWQADATQVVFKNIALVFNALITVFAAYEIFFEPRKLWVRETVVYSKLKDISRDLEFALAGGKQPDDAQLADYKKRIGDVLQSSLDDWVSDKNNS